MTIYYNIEGIMDEAEDKIIVFEAYDTVMAANLVKTKLDAYGIPCFLSDENFVGLYPIRNELFPGVRLHIFEYDKQRVADILNEGQASNLEKLVCPNCGNDKIEFEMSKKDNPLKGALLFFGILLPSRKVYCCQQCKAEFDMQPDNTKS